MSISSNDAAQVQNELLALEEQLQRMREKQQLFRTTMGDLDERIFSVQTRIDDVVQELVTENDVGDILHHILVIGKMIENFSKN